MELVCCERITENRAIVDPVLLNQEVLKKLLQVEDKSVVSRCDVQDEITSKMRKIVIVWMKEVTEEQKCQLEVFLLAVNYMNRFLKICKIRKNQLQLLGTACMLIASKLRESAPLTSELLTFYTDNSITVHELLQFEQLVLSKLKWKIAVVTPLDILQHLILKVPQQMKYSISQIHENAKALVSYCACEDIFWYIQPSIIAASCVVYAVFIQGREAHKGPYAIPSFFENICTITNIECEHLQIHVKNVENMIKKLSSTTNETDQIDNAALNETRNNEYITQPLTDKTIDIETATTPTDVHNINF